MSENISEMSDMSEKISETSEMSEKTLEMLEEVLDSLLLIILLTLSREGACLASVDPKA